MVAITTAATFATLHLLSVLVSTPLAGALPASSTSVTSAASQSAGAQADTNTSSDAQASGSSSSYWLASIKRQGTVASGDSSYKIYRNVHDYGAKGDGTTDDTVAINKAVTDGNRCGQGCDSSTVTPALVYFPPGTYVVSKPIIQLYYTQFVGDAISVPTIKAAAGFQGMAVIDSDPYDDKGANWYTNQNNFYRQIRNFVIDITAMPPTAGACIHWQVAQATSIQAVTFNMVKGGTGNKQQGIFMDNGSGGFMTDLTFNGGNYGMFLGNQQFTTRNLTFNNCNTAIFMNWNWLWNLKSLSVNDCQIGIDMSNGKGNQTVGSVIVQDSTFSNTPRGIVTAFSKTGNVPVTGGTLIIDNSKFSGMAVADASGTQILAGGQIDSFGQGHAYTTGQDGTSSASTCASAAPTASSTTIQGALGAPTKPASLMDGSKIFERSKPQYEHVAASSFVSVKSAGAKGDGKTDDTAAIQKIFSAATANQVVYFDHGAYLVSDTIKVPKDIKITGEIWPVILASGQAFSSSSHPTPVFQVGQPGDKGSVELSDLIFSTKGPAPGAKMIEWNVAGSSQGSAAMWDVHMRIGGATNTELQSDTCSKNPNSTHPVNEKCEGAYLLLDVTEKGSLYLENSWLWVADHELDLPDHRQIDIYNGRGVLVRSQGPVWMYGTSSEHSQLYNYQLANAKNVYMGIIQSETPYMQPNPPAPGNFLPTANSTSTYADPDFSSCKTDACRMAWGLRIFSSSDILIYGAGLYSFFDNYKQDCLAGGTCQENMIAVECSESTVIYGLNTKAAVNQVSVDGVGVVKASDNRDGFCDTLALFEIP